LAKLFFSISLVQIYVNMAALWNWSIDDAESYLFVNMYCGCVFVQNGNPQNPYCTGIAGIMDAYHRTLQAVQLYGPTNFSPVINHVARHVFHI